MADPSTLPPGFVLDAPPAAGTPTPLIPRTPEPQTPAQAAKDVADAQQAQFKASQEGLTLQHQQAQVRAFSDYVGKTMDAVNQARDLITQHPDMMSPLAFKVMKYVPGSPAAKLEALIDKDSGPLAANQVLQTVNQFRDEAGANPGGGGAPPRIFRSEIPLFAASAGVLDPGSVGPAAVLHTLDNMEYYGKRAQASVNGANPDDPAAIKQFGIPAQPTMQQAQDRLTGPPSPNVINTAPLPSPGGTPPPSSGPGGSPPPGGANPTINTGGFADQVAFNPAHAEEYANALHGAIASGQVKNHADLVAYAQQWNQQHGTNFGFPVQNANEAKGFQLAAQGKPNQFSVDIPQMSADEQQRVQDAIKANAGSKGAATAGGVADAATLGGINSLGAGVDSVKQFLSGKPVDYTGNLNANVDYSNAIRDPHPFYWLGGELAGGAALPSFGARTPAALAKLGGAYGAAYGFNSSAGQPLANRFTNAIIGGGEGAGLGFVGGKIFGGKEAYPAEGPAPPDIAYALQAEGIPAARPIADPSVRAKMAYLETTKGGNAPVQSSLAQTRQAIADKVAGLTGDGEASAPGTMGETLQGAGIRTLQDAKDAAKGVYTQADQAAKGAPINPTDALGKIDGYISQLSRNPETNGGVISYLQGVRNDLAAPGGKTVGDIRDIITGAEDKINYSGLQKTRAEAIMSDVNKSLNGDVSRDLGQSNPQALDLYNKADGMWRDMSNLRQQVVSRLVGPANNPLSGEQTMARITQMMSNKGDLSRFNRTMNMMTPDEQANFRASLWENIGQRSPEEGFTPDQFLAQTKNMQSGALKTVFGEDGATSIQNLRVASRGLLDAQSSLNNSRTGAAFNMKDALSSILAMKHTGAAGTGAAAGAAIGGTPGAIVGGIVGGGVGEAASRMTNGISARALMNPDVSSWIRKVSAAKTDGQARSLLGQLNGIAATDAAIQPEVGALRDFIMKAVNDNAPASGAAAASPDQRPNQQQ